MCVAQGIGLFLPAQLPLSHWYTDSFIHSFIPFLLGIFYVTGSVLCAGALGSRLPLAQSREGLLLKQHGCWEVGVM